MICGLSVCPGKNCPVYGEAGKTVGSQVKPVKLPAPDCWVKSGGLSGQPVINLTGSAKGCWNRMFCMISFFVEIGWFWSCRVCLCSILASLVSLTRHGLGNLIRPIYSQGDNIRPPSRLVRSTLKPDRICFDIVIWYLYI